MVEVYKNLLTKPDETSETKLYYTPTSFAKSQQHGLESQILQI